MGEAARRLVVTPQEAAPPNLRDEEKTDPRLELYHFRMSTCSQKSRVALFELGWEFGSNEIFIVPPLYENYLPDYVRLRMHSEAAVKPLVTGFGGGSSVRQVGFDPLVVPTLVDHEAGRIIADSAEILLYINQLSGSKLLPSSSQELILKQLAAVDAFPHGAMLYGANPDGDHRPMAIQELMRDVHDKKIAQIEMRKAELPETSELHVAYAHKLMKERAARNFVSTPMSMRQAIEQAALAVRDLASLLDASNTEWLCSDCFSLADIVWGISLRRLELLGYNWMWSELGSVHAYAERCFARPSLSKDAAEWDRPL